MSRITVIGGININIQVYPEGEIVKGQRHRSRISMQYGGGGRNVVENLARLGEDVAFVTLAGNDFAARNARNELADLGADISGVVLDDDVQTEAGLSIINIMNDPEYAFAGSNPEEKMDVPFLEPMMEKINGSDVIAIDGGLPRESIEMICERAKAPVFFDPMNIAGAEAAVDIIGRFHTIKPNRMEAEILSGMKILSKEEMSMAVDHFAEQGAEHVYITMGPGGVFSRCGADEMMRRPKKQFAENKEGSGDAFFAGLLSAFIRDMSYEETLSYAMAAATLNMESSKPVNEKTDMDAILREI